VYLTDRAPEKLAMANFDVNSDPRRFWLVGSWGRPREILARYVTSMDVGHGWLAIEIGRHQAIRL